jgi:hypothetical protein
MAGEIFDVLGRDQDDAVEALLRQAVEQPPLASAAGFGIE